MTKTFRGRTLNNGQLVDAYRNLHRGGFSLRDVKTGLVVAHTDGPVILMDVHCIVSEAGRQRVIESGTKNVHAFVRGHAFLHVPAFDYERRLTYNPFKAATFYDSLTGDPITDTLDSVVLFGDRVYYKEAA